VTGDTRQRYADSPLVTFLDELASGEPLPAGGAAAGLAVALAGALAAMVARRRGESSAAEIADRLRRRASALAEEDVVVYRRVLDVQGIDADKDTRDAQLRAALSDAADVPLEIAEVAAEVTAIIDGLGGALRGDIRGDGLVAARLAAGAAAGAAALVRGNLGGAAADERIRRATDAESSTRESAERFAEAAR
jgi:formiminotetrahydrofolate cyclodeaminase